jgi:hypothetical protein
MEKAATGTELFKCRECGHLIPRDADYVVIRKATGGLPESRNHAACAENAAKK